VKAREEIGQKL